jgi:NAD(P)-dependent dehydrogenase (short-subunit alcohol dehydrogenase family)
MTVYKRNPAYQLGYNAYVAGAREDSGNIGDAVVGWLARRGWHVVGDDCEDRNAEFGYSPPLRSKLCQFDTLVVTLGKATKDDFESNQVDVEEMIRANLTLPLEVAQAFVRATFDRARAGGMFNIVFVGSYAHDHPFSAGTLYCAAKAGLNMAARTLGWELTGKGYRVHIVNPWHVEGTPMWESVQDGVMESKGMTREEADAYAFKDMKMDTKLSPATVADVIGNLLVNESFDWMSGGAINLYGGVR